MKTRKSHWVLLKQGLEIYHLRITRLDADTVNLSKIPSAPTTFPFFSDTLHLSSG